MMFFKRFKEDIDAFIARDPAARSRMEVVLCYPGFLALLFYRASHWFWCRKWKLLARFVSSIGRIITLIEIHPGASIGKRFVIDHGSGIVIGETSIIGDDVTLYQGVTLGGVSPSVDSHLQVNRKRHPTLANNVIIGSGAQVLGPIVVGEGARIGSNAVVHKDIPAGVTAVGIPARVVMPRDKKKAGLFVAYGEPVDGSPDPVLQTIEDLRNQLSLLKEKVEELSAGNDANESDNTDKKKVSVASGGKS